MRTAFLVLLAVLTSTCLAAEEDGFVPLFNGKDLSGWVGIQIAPDTFTVKDGIIICSGVPIGILRTEKMYENFIVECEWRHLRPGGNAGFFVWSDALTAKGQPFTRSVEIQVLDGPGHPENNYTTHGDVFPIHGATMKPDNPGKFGMRSYPTEKRSKPSPEWNHYRIECNNGVVKLAVNGKVVTSGQECSPRKGYICLESEGGLVHWRNLKIKELPGSGELAEKDVAEADRGFESLYNGVNLEGWSALTEAHGKWAAKDWMLRFEPTGDKAAVPAPLLSRETYGEMELIFDAKTAGEVSVYVGGDPKWTLPAQKAAWRRVYAVVKGGKMVVSVDGKEVSEIIPVGEGKIGFLPREAADFANVFVLTSK